MRGVAAVCALLAIGCATDPQASFDAAAKKKMSKAGCVLGAMHYYERWDSGGRWDDAYCLREAAPPPEADE